MTSHWHASLDQPRLLQQKLQSGHKHGLLLVFISHVIVECTILFSFRQVADQRWLICDPFQTVWLHGWDKMSFSCSANKGKKPKPRQWINLSGIHQQRAIIFGFKKGPVSIWCNCQLLSVFVLSLGSKWLPSRHFVIDQVSHLKVSSACCKRNQKRWQTKLQLLKPTFQH